MKRRKRDTEIFSLSFLDCICCGFGAVLLIFVLTVGKKSDTIEKSRAIEQVLIGELNDEIDMMQNDLRQLDDAIVTQRSINTDLDNENDKKKRRLTKLEEELALLLAQLASLEETNAKLLRTKEHMPKQEEKTPIPIPNEIRRQYLTGFDIHGDNVLFLVEASGGMTSDNIEDAGALLGADDEDKINSPKWTRVKRGIRWMIANMKPDSQYKIIFYNNEVSPLETSYGSSWFDPKDDNLTKEILELLDEVVPNEGANLERALDIVDELEILPDRVVLIADGLPTLGDSYDGGDNPGDHERIQMFRAAKKAYTADVQINILLYPMKGDPGAAVYFWRLSNDTGGAMVCPSKSWPDIDQKKKDKDKDGKEA